MAWPEDGKAVYPFACGASREDLGVRLLGSNERLDWRQTNEGLVVFLPTTKPGNSRLVSRSLARNSRRFPLRIDCVVLGSIASTLGNGANSESASEAGSGRWERSAPPSATVPVPKRPSRRSGYAANGLAGGPCRRSKPECRRSGRGRFSNPPCPCVAPPESPFHERLEHGSVVLAADVLRIGDSLSGRIPCSRVPPRPIRSEPEVCGIARTRGAHW
jgi:hypothetical protein